MKNKILHAILLWYQNRVGEAKSGFKKLDSSYLGWLDICTVPDKNGILEMLLKMLFAKYTS